MSNDAMRFDVVIVGGGPAGLSAAIRLRQLAIAANHDVSVCVLEKASEIGAHILSGCVLEPRALNELLPDWQSCNSPITLSASHDCFAFLTSKHAINLPVPPSMHNRGNYIVSLANVCRWLATQAEALGVQIFPGFAAVDVLMENGRVAGIITGEFGRSESGGEKNGYQPGIPIAARFTLLAEGCRGSLSQQLIATFALNSHAQPQTYGLGIKELWEIVPSNHRPGQVFHSIGWPLDSQTYGGSFIYHMADNIIAMGLITGLDYSNPSLDPFEEFQRFKTHPTIRPLLAGGRRIAYGAKSLIEGGFQSIPALAFPGGALVGDAAGFLNIAKIKGAHTAMKSGMLAAEATFNALTQKLDTLAAYPVMLRQSWLWDELKGVRNIRPGFRHGLYAGMANAAIESYLLRGHAPWTLAHHTPDHQSLRPASQCKRIHYPAPDGVITFDKLSSIYLSNTNHQEDQPVHLRLRDPALPQRVNLPQYGGPEQYYCPASVYEYVDGQLAIHAQNCVHCKSCDIKDPMQNIVWTPPEGGGGPNYGAM